MCDTGVSEVYVSHIQAFSQVSKVSMYPCASRGGWRGNACQVFKNTDWCLAPKGSSAFGIRVTGIRPSPPKRVKWWWWCRGGKCCVGAHILLAAPIVVLRGGMENARQRRTRRRSRVRGFVGSGVRGLIPVGLTHFFEMGSSALGVL